MTESKLNREEKRKRKKVKNTILSILVLALLISAPVIGIVNTVKIHQINDDIQAIKKEQMALQKQLDKQAADHKKLNDVVWNMSEKVEKVEKTYQYVDRGGIDRALPAGIDTSAKTYMDYRAINAGTQQKLQNEAWTDDQGFRRLGDDYMVALGTYYGVVGDRFEITLSYGKVFTAVKGDAKSNADTDVLHMHKDGNVIEFIVDAGAIEEKSKQRGDMSYSGFSGKIKSIRGIV
jgi:uncharacterized iron-regulated membrane protein